MAERNEDSNSAFENGFGEGFEPAENAAVLMASGALSSAVSSSQSIAELIEAIGRLTTEERAAVMRKLIP